MAKKQLAFQQKQHIKLPPILDKEYTFDDVTLKALVTFPKTNDIINDYLSRLCHLRQIPLSDEDVTQSSPMVAYILAKAKELGFKLDAEASLYKAKELYRVQRESTLMDAAFLAIFANKFNEEVIKNQPIIEEDEKTGETEDEDYMLPLDDERIPALDIFYDMNNILEIRANKIRAILNKDRIQVLRIFGPKGDIDNLPYNLFVAALESDATGFQS